MPVLGPVQDAVKLDHSGMVGNNSVFDCLDGGILGGQYLGSYLNENCSHALGPSTTGLVGYVTSGNLMCFKKGIGEDK